MASRGNYSAAERGLVTCYVLFFIYLESSGIDISRITNCPSKPWKLRVTRNVRIRGRGTRQRCYALQDRDTIYFTSFQATRPARAKCKRRRREVDGSPRERVFVQTFLAIAHRIESRRAILNKIIKKNPSSHCCGRLRIRAAKKRHDPASGGVNTCVLTNKTRRE
jgi:hypothetical protein